MDVSRIAAILYEEWDPIGVKGLAPKDEYESYAVQIGKILDRGGSREDVLGLLDRTRLQEMMLKGDHRKDAAVADLIVECQRGIRGTPY